MNKPYTDGPILKAIKEHEAGARDRLRRLDVNYEHCWAFTRPGCNRREAHESWAAAGKALASAMNHRSIRGEESEWR